MLEALLVEGAKRKVNDQEVIVMMTVMMAVQSIWH